MKEQQKRKFKQIHPKIEDGIDLRRCPPLFYFMAERVKHDKGMFSRRSQKMQDVLKVFYRGECGDNEKEIATMPGISF